MRQRRRAIIRICLSALLFVLLFTALFVGLTLWRMNDTILSAEYYAVPLGESGFYEFLMTEAVLSALDESGIEEDLTGDSLNLSNERLAILAYSLHPPDLLRDKVEYILSEMGRYSTGETDSFSMTVLPGMREDAVVSELRALLRELDVYELFQDQFVAPLVDEAVAGTRVADFGVSDRELREAARSVLHREWFEAQADVIVREAVPYLLGREDGFSVSGRLSDRVEAAAQETKRLLRDSDAYGKFRTEVIDYTASEWIPEPVEMSYGIVLTPDEVKSALIEVAPLEWLRTEAERAIDESLPFATGRTDTLVLQVDLRDRKRRAAEIVRATAVSKLDDRLADLPVCSREMSAAELSAVLSGTDLECAPVGHDVVAIRSIPEVVALAAVQVIDESVPDVYVFSLTHEELDDRLKEAIGFARRGWEFTDADLRRSLSEDSLPGAEDLSGTLEVVRELLSEGWTYNHIQFRRDMGHSQVVRLDRDRSTLDILRLLRWVLLAVPILLLALGLAAGGDWRGRLLWASGAMVLASLATIGLIGPFGDSVLAPYLEGVLRDIVSELFRGADLPRTEELVGSRIPDVVDIAVADVSSGVTLAALLPLGAGVLALAARAAVALADDRSSRGQKPGTPEQK